MEKNIKARLLHTINKIMPLDDYESSDCIFSQKYSVPPALMVYTILKLADDFNFTITDDFVDALENCTFGKLESLLEQHEGTKGTAA